MPIYKEIFDKDFFFNVRLKKNNIFMLRITLMSELFFESFSGEIPY